MDNQQPTPVAPATLSAEEAKQKLATLREKQKKDREEEKAIKKAVKIQNALNRLQNPSEAVKNAITLIFTSYEVWKEGQEAINAMFDQYVPSLIKKVCAEHNVELTDAEAKVVTETCFT